MSLEAKIEALTGAVIELTSLLKNAPVLGQLVGGAPAVPINASVPAPPVVPAPAPAPTMPAPPSFLAPVPPTAAPAVVVPFSDAKGLLDYTMASYQILGAEKGAKIQGIFNHLGYAQITDIQPQHYLAFFSQVEALKAS